VSRGVQFSFRSDAEKNAFQEIAEKRGQTLSQFVRWCTYKYRMDCVSGSEASKAYRARRRGGMVRSYTESIDSQ